MKLKFDNFEKHKNITQIGDGQLYGLFWFQTQQPVVVIRSYQHD